MNKIQLKDVQGNPVYPIAAESLEGLGNIDNTIPQVRIISSLLTPDEVNNTIYPLNTTKNPVPSDEEFSDECTLQFISGDIHFTDRIIIAYQGATSTNAPKKGFSIDMEHKHRFNDWLEMDSFHLKGYYTDWLHAYDLTANRIIEQIYQHKLVAHRRPYMFFNDFNGDIRPRIDGGALCHVDGIPCELYINDVYWGLYSLNIKKTRSNFLQKKNDVNHIQIEAAEYGTIGQGFSWENLEIRNPKKDSGNSSFEEGQTPNDGEVKTSWTAFTTFLSTITTSTSKEDIEGHLIMDAVIDAILMTDFISFWDSWGHNFLWTTWDGTHYAPLLYDMDLTFGKYWRAAQESYPQGDVFINPDWNPWTRNGNNASPHNACPWLLPLKTIYATEIKERYALYRKDIFTVDNVSRLFTDWTMRVGSDAYERDLERWTYPSFTENDGLPRIEQWMNGRLSVLDTKYEYAE